MEATMSVITLSSLSTACKATGHAAQRRHAAMPPRIPLPDCPALLRVRRVQALQSSYC